MTMQAVDWVVLIVPIAAVTWIALKTRKYTRSVADFMAASRCAGRYLVATAQGEATYGATNVVAQFEMFLLSGFTLGWWLISNNVIWLFILLSGFIIYRYRESRVMTLAQFFEIRYSKAFRIFAGCLAFLSGLLSYGIYPAVGARFFIYFCGLPHEFQIAGLTIPMVLPIMVILLLPGVLMTTMGGQLTLMVTDCLEGIISLIFYLCVAATLMYLFSWADISKAMQDVPPGQSLFHPFDTAQNKDFGFWYMMIAIFASAYGWQSSQVGHGFRSAAINAHEQKMGAIVGPWRNEVRTLMLTVLCICAIAFLKSPEGQAAVAGVLESAKGVPASQLRTPTALGLMFPPVIRGMFAAIMLFALISTDCTMMHSWGTIFVQDIVVPLRKKPMETQQHVTLLRCAVVGVALFAFFWSWLVPQAEYINMYLAIMGAIFYGAGACIIGGFYWKRGTTAAAWAAMVGAAVVSVAGFAVRGMWKKTLFPWLHEHASGFLSQLDHIIKDVISANIPNLNWNVNPNEFFLNGQWIWFFAVIVAILSYVIVSFLTYKQDFNLDRMLHRGQYALPEEGHHAQSTAIKRKFSFKLLVGITPEFTTSDKVISMSLFLYRIAWFIVFAVITVWNIPTAWRWPESWWINFWHVTFVWLPFFIAAIMVVWFTWGGIRDIRQLFQRLDKIRVDARDDGTVVGHHNLADERSADRAATAGTDSNKQ